MKGVEADKIADALNEAGYRAGSKRSGARLFTKDTVTAMLRNEFYVAYLRKVHTVNSLHSTGRMVSYRKEKISWTE